MKLTFHFFRFVRPNYNWFRLVHYLSIKSFLKYNPNSVAELHFDEFPYDSNWFRLLLDEYGERLTLRQCNFADKDKFSDIHHAIDQVAATTIYQEGGVITDMDMICLSNISNLFGSRLTISSELDYYDRHTIALGIGFMGTMLPDNKIIGEYLDRRKEYKKDKEWGKYSTELMYKIYEKNKDEFNIIPQKMIDPFGPQYTELQNLFLHNRPILNMTKCIHLSESASWDQYLKHMTVEHIMTVDTTFTKCVRDLISDNCWDGSHDLIGLY